MTSWRGGGCASISATGVTYENKAKIKMGCKWEHKVPPSLANLCELVPPAFAHPVYIPEDEAVVNMTLVDENWPTEIDNVEERIVVEGVAPEIQISSIHPMFYSESGKRSGTESAFRVWTVCDTPRPLSGED